MRALGEALLLRIISIISHRAPKGPTLRPHGAAPAARGARGLARGRGCVAHAVPSARDGETGDGETGGDPRVRGGGRRAPLSSLVGVQKVSEHP